MQRLGIVVLLLASLASQCQAGKRGEGSSWEDELDLTDDYLEDSLPVVDDYFDAATEGGVKVEKWEISSEPGWHPALIAAAAGRSLRAMQRSLIQWQDWKDPNRMGSFGYLREGNIPDIVKLDPHASILRPAPHNGAEQVFLAPYDNWQDRKSTDHGMTISWVTPQEGQTEDPYVYYGESEGEGYPHKARATVGNYRQGPSYRSGQIYHAKLEGLRPSQKYFYRLGKGRGAKEGQFYTTPERGADVPYTFAIVGDTGQTPHSVETFRHVVANRPDMVLHTGDLSYADGHSKKWDFWGRITDAKANTASVPWLFAPGNHEIEYPHSPRFQAYLERFRMPYDKSGARDNRYYSAEVASAHLIFLNPYSGDLHEGAEQYRWLEHDLAAVNRHITPWLVVIIHVPVYSSNGAHFEEGERGRADLRGFRVRQTLEPLFFRYAVDFVFAGHVHAYERFRRLYKGELNKCGPVYFTIGDGGNWEGPEPGWKKGRVHGIDYDQVSAMHEASFGHATLQLLSRDEAVVKWYRNQDGLDVVSDIYRHDKANMGDKCTGQR